METVPISNLATAGLPPQVLSKASGVSSATGASGPKVFAQVVGEVLNRHASSSIAQPVAPSRVTTAPKTAARAESAPRSAKDEPHRAESSNRTNPPNLNLLLNLVMPLQLPALDSLRLPDLALSGNPTVSGAIAAGAAATGPAMGGNGAGSTAPTPGREPKTAGLPAQDIGAALAQQTAAQVAAAASVPALPTTASGAAPGASQPSGGTRTADEKVPTSPQPASNASSAPAVGPQTKVSDVQPPLLAPAVKYAQLLAPLPPQVSQLQDASAGTHSTVANTDAQSAPHTQPEQGNGWTHVPLQFTVGPALLAALTADPKGLPPVIDAARANPPVETSPSLQHTASQDTGSNHKEPGRADAPPSAGVPSTDSAARDVTSFSVSLDAANAKQDASQASSSALAVGLGAPSASPERGASSPGVLLHADPLPAPSSPPSLPGMEAAAGRLVNNAQLVQAAGHSEMRIAMDSDKLGAVELRARMIGDVVGAAITVEKREAHAILAVEMPALQQALSDKHLRIEQVTLSHGSFNATTGDASGSTRQDERSATHATMTPWSPDGRGAPSIFTSAEQLNIFNSQGRLSVHA